MAAVYTQKFNTDELNIFVHVGANAETTKQFRKTKSMGLKFCLEILYLQIRHIEITTIKKN